MMSMTEELYYFGNKNYEMCKLNYKENDLCAYIILPLSENINEVVSSAIKYLKNKYNLEVQND